jgi:RNA polymerase sigma-70 factor (ECF subfamily)
MAAPLAPIRARSRYSYEEMLLSHEEDSGLAREARSGNRAAFDELVRRYQKKVYRIAFGILRSSHDADDAVQDIFIRAYRYLPSLDLGRSFEGWLMGIAMNQARTMRSRRRTATSETSQVAAAEKPARDVEMHAAALQAVSALPEKQREAMLLHLNTELTTQEIGEILGCSKGAAGVHLHRARAALRKALGPWLVLPSTP